MTEHNPNEVLAIVDPNDLVIGKATREEAHKGLLHREVAVIVTNDKNEVLIQERADNGKFTFSAGGHFSYNENYLQGAVRETEEEIGLKIPEEKFLLILKKRLISQKGANDRFLTIWELKGNYSQKDFVIDSKEVKSVKFMQIPIILEMINSVPWVFTTAFAAIFPVYVEKRKGKN